MIRLQNGIDEVENPLETHLHNSEKQTRLKGPEGC